MSRNGYRGPVTADSRTPTGPTDPIKATATPPPDERVRRALELLSEAAQDRLRRHPQGHLVNGAREGIELSMPLPLSSERDADRAAVAGAARSIEDSIAAAIDGLLLHRSAFRPGRVYCLRCESAECEHAVLPSPRATFAGYGPSGMPRFVDFAQWLVERHDPRAGDLYSNGSHGVAPVIAVPLSGEDLTAQLLDVYRDRTAGYRLHGQVNAGFYRVADRRGHEAPIAVTFQVVSSRPEGNRRRYSLNVLALGPEGEPPEHLFDRLGESPWGAQVRWAASVLDSIERSVAKARGGSDKSGGAGQAKKGTKTTTSETADSATPGAEAGAGKPGASKKRGSKQKGRHKKAEAAAERRIAGLVEGLARRLEKGKRAQARRTKHAAERHDQGDRPTRMALADLAGAKDEDVLLDTQRRTFIVLGEKGRAHVFNRQGKLVTSIRYAPDAIERRRQNGRWKPLPAVEITALRAMVEGEQAAAGHSGGAGAG